MKKEQFQRKYHGLLKNILNSVQKEINSADISLSEHTNNNLIELKKIRVIGFGTNDDWRKNGIWESLNKLTDFHLFEIPDDPYLKCRNEEEERQLKEQDFITYIKNNTSFQIAFFSHSGRHISSNLLQKLKDLNVFTIIMSVDDKHQFNSPSGKDGTPHQIRVSTLADLYWTNWPLAVPLVNSLGGNGFFSPPGANPDIYYPRTTKKDIDVCFVGLNYGERSKIIGSLSRYFRVEAYGKGWESGPVSFNEMLNLYSRAKIVLGIGGVNSTLSVQTLKGRDFEVPMCGATYLTSFNPELAEFFNIGKEIICWSTVENCIEIIYELLNHPKKCEDIGKNARLRSVSEHTWDIRIKKILDIFCHLKKNGDILLCRR